MATLLKLLVSLFPFIKEMILKDEESRQFVQKNKHSLYTSTATVILFLLFLNAYVKNMEFSAMVLESKRETAYFKERYEGLLTRHEELRSEHGRVRSALFACYGIPGLMVTEENKDTVSRRDRRDDVPPSPLPPPSRDAAIVPISADRKRDDQKILELTD